MTFNPLFDDWEAEIDHALDQSKALVVGAFDRSGQARYLNAGLRALLGGAQGELSLINFLVNPPFAALTDAPGADGVVYQGWFTFVGSGLPHCTVQGTARRKGEVILLIAEYDVEELARVNHEIMLLNNEITNLQRELARQKAVLEHTLDELRETQAMLIQSAKMSALGQMVAGIAHEINNPLAFITSNLYSLGTALSSIWDAYTDLENLALGFSTSEQREQVAQIRRKADLDFLTQDLTDLLAASLDGLKRVKNLVDKLRTFSRLDEAEFKTADVQECIENALLIARPQLGKRIQVTLDLDHLPPLACYPAELNQVFLNLIINAAQAIEGEGQLIIRGRDEGHQLVLSFTDTGCGMPPEIIERIFEPFFTTKPVGTGIGLGLAIVYKIITDRHRGTIEVDSVPTRGSTFTIRLPKDIRG